MDYICSKCGKKTSVSTRQARCSCGGLWKLDFTPPPFRPDGIDKSQWSQFRYRKYMALEDESWRELTLGEGMTSGGPHGRERSFKNGLHDAHPFHIRTGGRPF